LNSLFAETNFFEQINIEVLLAIVLGFLFINGFFVALEFALVALRETRIEEMVKEGQSGAKAVLHGKRNVDDYVAAAQLGITVASLVLGAAGEALFRVPLRQMGLNSPVALTLLSLALMTVLHVVVGEQVPKMLAIQKPDTVARTTAPFTQGFVKLCRPGIWFLSRLTQLLLRPFGVKTGGSHGHGVQIYSEEEIQALLGLREAAGLAETGESEMVSRVFSFFDMVATQVMVPRTEMVCVPSTSTLRELAVQAAEERHERYPVYGENLDDIKGVVLLKDAIGAVTQQRGLDAPVTTLMREILAVPGSLSVSALMRQMKKHRTRLAVVLDEFGGTAGMVTYGDLLERIVGEVEETSNAADDDEDILPLSDGSFSVSGLVLITDVESHFDVDIDDEHNDTIGGTVFSHLGRKPAVGDVVETFGLRFEVESMDGLRIDRLRITLLQSGEESEKELLSSRGES